MERKITQEAASKLLLQTNSSCTPLIEKLALGLTNSNYVISIENDKFFVKIYSDIGFPNDRQLEHTLVELLNPEIKLYFASSYYRIETFLDDYKPTSLKVVRDPSFLPIVEYLIKQFNSALPDTTNEYKTEHMYTAILAPVLNDVKVKMSDLLLKEILGEDFKFLNTIISEISEYFEYLRCFLPPRIVLTHHDINNLNILTNSSKCLLIDFDYVAFNHEGFDLINFFVESEIDFDVADFPYFKISDNFYNLTEISEKYKFFKLFMLKEEDASWEAYLALIGLVNLFWSLFAIKQANLEGIKEKKEFDFLGYAVMRLKLFGKAIQKLEQNGKAV